VVDDFTRTCLAIEVDTSIGGRRVVQVLQRLVETRGKPAGLLMDNVLSARGAEKTEHPGKGSASRCAISAMTNAARPSRLPRRGRPRCP